VIARVLVRLPDAGVAAVTGGSIVISSLLVLGLFHRWLVLPLVVVAAAAAVVLVWRLTRDEDGAGRAQGNDAGGAHAHDAGGAHAHDAGGAHANAGEGEPGGWPQWLPIVLLLVGATVSTVNNVLLSSRYINVSRDPGIYAVLGRWLVDHPSLRIQTRPELFGDVIAVVPESPGFYGMGGGFVEAQGMHLLPGWLAIVGWTGSQGAMLSANALFGGTVLLACYSLARRFVGPWWSLLPPTLIALSLPFLAFTRSPYTEPLNGTLLLGGASLLVLAVRRGSLLTYAWAGTTLAAASLSRADSLAAYLGLVPLAALLLVRATGPAAPGAGPGGTRRRMLLALLVPMVAIGGLALVDLYRYAGLYGPNLTPQLTLIAAAGGGLAVLGTGLVLLARARGGALLRWWDRHRGVIAWVAAGSFVALALGIASRPLWYVSRQNIPAGYPQMEAFQRAFGQPEDPTRSYDELTVNWLAWYFGWIVVVVAAAGLALLVHRSVRRRDLAIAALLLLVLPTTLMYLLRASIFPDQVWAMRRYLPLIVPGLLIALTYALQQLVARLRRVGALAALVVTSVALYEVLAASLPLWSEREYVAQYAEVQAVCQALGPDAILLLDLGGGSVSAGYQQTYRSYCQIPVQGVFDPKPQELAELSTAAAEEGRQLYLGVLLQSRPQDGPPGLPDLGEVTIHKWAERLNQLPVHVHEFTRLTRLGLVQDDGSFLPVEVLT